MRTVCGAHMDYGLQTQSTHYTNACMLKPTTVIFPPNLTGDSPRVFSVFHNDKDLDLHNYVYTKI